MNAAHRYLAHVQDMLHRLEATQSGAIDRAAALCADALTAGHRLFVSRDGSHALHTELVHRAGGFVDLAILQSDTALRAGDVVIIGTNAGFDASTVGLALRCRAMGVRTIGITTVDFERSIDSSDVSGKKLHEVVDVCVDQGGVTGDAAIALLGLDVAAIPSSGVLCLTAAWMILAATAERMIAADRPPRIFQAIQLPGAKARNIGLQDQAARSLSSVRR